MLPEWAGEYVGLPYRDRGRGPDAFDCWGLVRHVLIERADLPVPDCAQQYQGAGDLSGTERAFADYLGAWVPVQQPQRFDVAVYRLQGRLHCALVLGAGWMLHVGAGFNPSLCDRLDRWYWTNRLENYYRHAAG